MLSSCTQQSLNTNRPHQLHTPSMRMGAMLNSSKPDDSRPHIGHIKRCHRTWPRTGRIARRTPNQRYRERSAHNIRDHWGNVMLTPRVEARAKSTTTPVDSCADATLTKPSNPKTARDHTQSVREEHTTPTETVCHNRPNHLNRPDTTPQGYRIQQRSSMHPGSTLLTTQHIHI